MSTDQRPTRRRFRALAIVVGIVVLACGTFALIERRNAAQQNELTTAEGEATQKVNSDSSPGAASNVSKTGRDWIVTGADAKSLAAPPPATKRAAGSGSPADVPNGPGSTRLQDRMARSGKVGAGWTVQNAIDHPDASGSPMAEVTYLGPGPIRVRVIQQELAWPIDAQAITGGQPGDEIKDLASGDRVAVVNRLLPDLIQVVLVNGAGSMVNITSEWLPAGASAGQSKAAAAPVPHAGPPLDAAALIEIAQSINAPT